MCIQTSRVIIILKKKNKINAQQLYLVNDAKKKNKRLHGIYYFEGYTHRSC